MKKVFINCSVDVYSDKGLPEGEGEGVWLKPIKMFGQFSEESIVDSFFLSEAVLWGCQTE